MTALTNSPDLINRNNDGCCLNVNESALCCRSVVSGKQWRCELCFTVLSSENGVRRHFMLIHRHIYVRHGQPIYVKDDDEYAYRCARMCRNQRHHRKVASQHQTATGSVPAGTVPQRADRCRSVTSSDGRQPSRRSPQSQAAADSLATDVPVPVTHKTPPTSGSGCMPRRHRRVNNRSSSMFHIADGEAQLDTDDDVTSGALRVRGVFQGEHSALHLDPEQSDFMPDFLDDFLWEHAAEFDSEAGVLDTIGMAIQDDGLDLVESAGATSHKDVGTAELFPPFVKIRLRSRQQPRSRRPPSLR